VAVLAGVRAGADGRGAAVPVVGLGGVVSEGESGVALEAIAVAAGVGRLGGRVEQAGIEGMYFRAL